MTEFEYYVVESSFVVRVGHGTTERLSRDGSWEEYPDRWDVLSNGRLLESEEKALETPELLFRLADAYDAGRGETQSNQMHHASVLRLWKFRCSRSKKIVKNKKKVLTGEGASGNLRPRSSVNLGTKTSKFSIPNEHLQSATFLS